MNKTKEKYITVTEVAKHFNITGAMLNKIFIDLSWSHQEDKWRIATELGVSNGAKQL